MSLARIYHTKKSRKVWTCGSCREVLPIGSPVISFAVGFRGMEQKRCTKPGCYPTPSQRESSAVAAVYAAQESVDFSACQSLDDLDAAVQEVADAANEVADEYESSEMYEINYDLQERAETLHTAADELDSWKDGLDEEPDEDGEECEDCGGTGEVDEDSCETCDGTGRVSNDEAREEWLEAAREAAQEAIDNMELP